MLPSVSFAAEDIKYPVATIADSLKKDAYAVIRENSEIFVQNDVNQGTYRVTKVITILSKQGDDFAHFSTYSDRFRELTDFSGVIRDASGKVLKRIKKGDLTFSSISVGAGTDDNLNIFYICSLPSYPCTVEYTYQEKWKNGIISYPTFSPQEDCFESVEKSDLRIETPSSIDIRERNNFGGKLTKEIIGGKHVYTISMSNKKAVVYEPLSPSFDKIFPIMMTAPVDICLDSYCGNMSDWGNYGLWISTLLKGRDELSPDLVTKIQALVQDVKTDREKVSIVYDYLQKNFRYVSIQLGIGGLQPIGALMVSKMGFGDCKGLTNLMKAMLTSVGVESRYCVIRLDEKEKDIYPDFPNFSQLNHVMLMIPQKSDSIWLECTSQIMPFGYIHQGIAGHNAIVISDKGGHLVRLPSYTDKQNRKVSIVDIAVNEDGDATGRVVFEEYLSGYERTLSGFRSNDNERISRYINSNMRVPHMKIEQLTVSEDKSEYPSSQAEASFIASDFANRTGTRLFVPICPLSKTNFNVLTASSRYQDIDIKNGFSESDTIVITIPQSYALESLPKDIDISTLFGSLKTQAKIDGDKVLYIQEVDIISGRHDRSKYAEIKDLFAQITAASKRNLVLKKL